MSDEVRNDRGPLELTIKDGALGADVLRRCHDDGCDANDATALLWRRQLRKTGNVMGEGDSEETLPTADDEEEPEQADDVDIDQQTRSQQP